MKEAPCRFLPDGQVPYHNPIRLTAASLAALTLACLICAGTGHAQQNVYSRNDSGTNLWDNGTNKPWYYQTWNSTENRPDIWPVGTRNDVFFGHNNNLVQDVNGTVWYALRSLTMQASASSARTFNSSGGAGISLSSAFTNEAGSGAHTFNTSIGVDGSTVTFTNNGGKISFSGGNFYVNGNTAAFAGSGDFDVSAVMSGSSGSVTKSGTGTLKLLTNNHTYTGSTTVSAGKLTTAVTLATSAVSVSGGEFETTADHRLADTATLAISAGTIDIQGNDTVASLASTGGSVTIGSGKTLSVSGTSSIGTGSTLTGGTMEATGGTLTFNSASGNSSALIIGTAAKLTGTGVIGGTTTVNGVHAVGASTAAGVTGAQTVASSLNYGSASIFEWDINTAASSSDSVSVSGSLVISSGAIFKVVSTTAFTDAFWNTTRNWNVFGGLDFDAFTLGYVANGLSQNAGDFASQGSFSFTNSGQTLTWTAVPEPSSLLAGGLLAAGLARRRRHH